MVYALSEPRLGGVALRVVLEDLGGAAGGGAQRLLRG
jgi:hypothetical protein